jgi:hypothetical protein
VSHHLLHLPPFAQQVRTASCGGTACVNSFGDEQLAVDMLADKLLFEALRFSVSNTSETGALCAQIFHLASPHEYRIGHVTVQQPWLFAWVSCTVGCTASLHHDRPYIALWPAVTMQCGLARCDVLCRLLCCPRHVAALHFGARLRRRVSACCVLSAASVQVGVL